MVQSRPGVCLACRATAQVRNINLYTIGSEGTDLCHDCEMAVVEFIRMLMRVGSTAHKDGWKRGRGSLVGA